MTHSDLVLVTELHDAIQAAIGHDRYEVWFADQVTLELLPDTQLRVSLPDEFSLEQVRRRFGVTLRSVCDQVLETSHRVHWCVDPAARDRLVLESASTLKQVAADASLDAVASSSASRDDTGPHEVTGPDTGSVQDVGPTQKPHVALVRSRMRDLQASKKVVSEDQRGDNRLEQLKCSTRSQTELPAGSAAAPQVNSRMPQAASTSPAPATQRAARGARVPAAAGTDPRATLPLPGSRSTPQRPQGEFRSFVHGDNAAFAFSAAQHAVKHLGEISPLFLYGPTGVGKTHLLQSIYASTRKSRRVRSLLLSSEQFTSSFLEALHGHGVPNFRRKYRQTDLLLLDDIQFFVGKRATLIELLHTLDALVQEGKQVVFAADRPPNELRGVGDELIARLSAGVVCGLEYPQGETKCRLVQQLAAERSLVLPDEIVQLLAEELPGDARRVKGALNRLAVLNTAVQGALTMDRVRRELADLFQASQRPVALQDIERAVCEVFGVEGKLLRSERKTKTVSQPRMLAMWLARKHTRAAFSEIGDFFGGRSHSTVISANQKVTRWVDSDMAIQVACGESKVSEAIRRIETTLRAM